MTQYIDKDEVMAEINRIEKELLYEIFTNEYLGKRWTCNHLKSFLNNLEVKEVDLDKGIEKELDTRWHGEYLDTNKFKESAKYFFELGLKTHKGE